MLGGFVTVTDGLWERHQFDKSSGAVGKATRIIRSALSPFGIGVDGSRVVGSLEFGITQVTRLVSFDGVDIGIALSLGLGFFSVAQLCENIRGSVLG